MTLISEINPSHCHPIHVLSLDPRPRCWIPRVPIHFQSLGQNPRYQMLSLNRDLTRHLERLGGSPPPSLPSGFSRTAQTRCQTVRSPRAASFRLAGHCLNPHRTAVFGACGGCQPRCRTCAGSHRNHSRKRCAGSAVPPRLCRCCCCGGVCQRQALVRLPGSGLWAPSQAENGLLKNKGI